MQLVMESLRTPYRRQTLVISLIGSVPGHTRAMSCLGIPSFPK